MPLASEIDPEEVEDDESYCTEFQTDGERSVDGGLLFDAVCPRCEHENTMEGDPTDFGGRPYGCVNCGLVSLFVPQSLQEIADAVGDDEELVTDGGESVGRDVLQLEEGDAVGKCDNCGLVVADGLADGFPRRPMCPGCDDRIATVKLLDEPREVTPDVVA